MIFKKIIIMIMTQVFSSHVMMNLWNQVMNQVFFQIQKGIRLNLWDLTDDSAAVKSSYNPSYKSKNLNESDFYFNNRKKATIQTTKIKVALYFLDIIYWYHLSIIIVSNYLVTLSNWFIYFKSWTIN